MRNSVLLSKLRLVSGLVLMTFVAGHLVNAALGLVSLQTMEDWRAVLMRPWLTLPGQVLLYGALVVHAGLGILSILRRPRLTLTRKDFAQIAFGLLIPALLAAHLLATRVAGLLADFQPGYSWILTVYWKWAPNYGLQQVFLVAVVWAHGCIGMLSWLNLRPWWPRIAAFAYPPVFALPILALLGFVHAGDEVLARLSNDAAFKAMVHEAAQKGAPVAPTLLAWQHGLLVAYALVVAVTLAPGAWRVLRSRFAAATAASIRYVDGPIVTAAVGSTLLDASRRHHVPHSAVCSGHARCGTCRVRITAPPGVLSPPSADEMHLLRHLHAGDAVRLACRATILRPVSFTLERLVPVEIADAAARGEALPSGGTEAVS